MPGPGGLPPLIVYFSSVSGNTQRFVAKLGFESMRIPMPGALGSPASLDEAPLRVDRPYVLIVPSYGGGHAGGAVPGPVVRFLNDARNRAGLRGVIGAGNTNFGAAYCLAGRIVASKCQVPLLYNFELLGTPEDVARVQHGVTTFWKQLSTLAPTQQPSA